MAYIVMNKTDRIPAAPYTFSTIEKAEEFIKGFRERFKQQGYYLTATGERIRPESVELVILPESYCGGEDSDFATDIAWLEGFEVDGNEARNFILYLINLGFRMRG